MKDDPREIGIGGNDDDDGGEWEPVYITWAEIFWWALVSALIALAIFV